MKSGRKRAVIVKVSMSKKKENPSITGLLSESTLSVARSLLGMTLTTRVDGEITSGMIVEVEAYDGRIDEACHCFYRRTKRNEVMFWGAGHCYVYQIYGIHHCINVVTEVEDVGAAVLIRALEPLEGIREMTRRRGGLSERELLRGPGKLCEGMAIDKTMLGEHFTKSSRVWLEPHRQFSDDQIISGSRIGITKAKDLPWRFYLKDSRFISRG